MANTFPDRKATVREVEALARVHTHTAIETLVTIMQDKEAPAAARVSAASIMLDRGWGKPKQVVQIDTGLEKLTDEQLNRTLSERIAQILAGAVGSGPPAGGADSGREAEKSPPKLPGIVH